jgi:MFS family permease
MSGRRKPFVWVAALIYAVGLVIVAFSGTFEMFLVGLAVCGVGQGVYFAVDLAPVTQVLPSKEDVAKDLGIFNIASAMPQSIAPAIAPIFLAIGGQQLRRALCGGRRFCRPRGARDLSDQGREVKAAPAGCNDPAGV